MKPVKTARANFVYRGPTVDIGDVWVERVVAFEPGIGPLTLVWMDWLPSPEEIEALRNGGVLRLGILSEPIPPVRLEVWQGLEVTSEEPPIPQE